MDSIWIKVEDLKEQVDELIEDGMDYVQISLFEAEDDLPAHVGIEAFRSDSSYEHIGYDGVDAAEF